MRGGGSEDDAGKFIMFSDKRQRATQHRTGGEEPQESYITLNGNTHMHTQSLCSYPCQNFALTSIHCGQLNPNHNPKLTSIHTLIFTLPRTPEIMFCFGPHEDYWS